jgi:hypothetical protein
MPGQTHAASRTLVLTAAVSLAAAASLGVIAARGDSTASSSATVDRPVRRVNVPYLGHTPPAQSFTPAIFWLGSVGMTANYADVRVYYFDSYVHFVVHITDRLLWYATTPDPANLTAWDAVSLYIDRSGSPGTAPGSVSFRFVKQLGNDGAASAAAAFRGNGTGWTVDAVPFTASSTWRGNYPNDGVWDMGWEADFEIPFASIGANAPPPDGTVWSLAVAVHDRDDAGGTPIPDQVWPEGALALNPSTWGQMRFGLPAYTPATSAVTGTTVVRQGLGGAVVPDAAVGGHGNCGGSMNAWTEWGFANYAGYTQFNIQNQWDISDFMCFSKYYVTFPLTSLPSGKSIVSARVTLNLFGNAGYNPGDAKPSAIDALTVSDDWSEATITWNNAPYASENISASWVYPIDSAHPAGPYDWDVSYAVAQAYKEGIPLRLAFYSTDGDYHSGKYFWSSDADNSLSSLRPTLEVKWGAVSLRAPAPPTNVRVIKEP